MLQVDPDSDQVDRDRVWVKYLRSKMGNAAAFEG